MRYGTVCGKVPIVDMTTCNLCCILERNQSGQRKDLSVVSASLHLIIIITTNTTAVQLSGTADAAAARNFGNKDHLLLRNFFLHSLIFSSTVVDMETGEVLMRLCTETL